MIDLISMRLRQPFMTKRVMVLLLLPVLALLAARLMTAKERTPYPILDSQFPTAEASLGWLDNERIIFQGFERDNDVRGNPVRGQVKVKVGLYIWDTGRNVIAKYADLNGTVPLCISDGEITYSTRPREEEKAWDPLCQHT
jgi:hypothetical protein